MKKSALICGISGQDGAYLASLLLEKNYRVIGTSRDAQAHGFTNLGKLGIEDKVSIIGSNCCSVYTTRDLDGNPSQPFRTLFIQELMKRGLMMTSSIVSYSHSDKDISDTIERMYDAMTVYRKALEEGIDKYLIGRPVAPVWRRYN